ncbi:MAG: hypothetical protein FWG09_07920 [Synergistaceae bacterium]|nr:hypothetical protein [Synergistaceae bacterium]
MRTEAMLKDDGMKIFGEHLGLVEAERFVALMIREPFDYTEWRQDLCEGMSVREISKKAMDYQKELNS